MRQVFPHYSLLTEGLLVSSVMANEEREGVDNALELPSVGHLEYTLVCV